MSEVDVGGKIQAYRKALNMTLKELANSINITSSMLSQIERGLANPSISTLRLIAHALNVPMFQFFVEETKSEDIIITQDKRIKINPSNENNEGVTYELLTPNLKGNIEYCIMTLEPGAKSSEFPKSHVGEEVCYMLSGDMILYYDSQTIEVKENTSLCIPPNIIHKWENRTDRTAQMIFAVTPPIF